MIRRVFHFLVLYFLFVFMFARYGYVQPEEFLKWSNSATLFNITEFSDIRNKKVLSTPMVPRVPDFLISY